MEDLISMKLWGKKRYRLAKNKPASIIDPCENCYQFHASLSLLDSLDLFLYIYIYILRHRITYILSDVIPVIDILHNDMNILKIID